MKAFNEKSMWAALAVALVVVSCVSDGPVQKRNASFQLPRGEVSTLTESASPHRVSLLQSEGDTGPGTGVAPQPGVSTPPPVPPIQAVWAKGVLEGSGGSELLSTAVDSGGNIYAVGSTSRTGTTTFEGNVSVKGFDLNTSALMVKYDTSGKVLWARGAEKADTETLFRAVAVDEAGNAYAVGSVWVGPVDFGSGVRVKGVALENLLIVKYNTQGKAQWARTVATADGPSAYNSVVVDPAGGIYAVGFYASDREQDVDLQNRAPGYTMVPQKTGGGGGALLAKYDSGGRVLWAAQLLGHTVSTWYESVALDKSGNVYVAGDIGGHGTGSLGNGVYLKGPSARRGVLLAKYSPTGKARWARGVKAGPADCAYRSVAVDAEGSVYAFGQIEGTSMYDFGNGVRVQGRSERRSPLLVKYDGLGNVRWARSLVRGSGDLEYHSSAVDGQFVYLSGALGVREGEGVDFGDGVAVDMGRNVGGYEFLAAYDYSGTPRWVKMPPNMGRGTILIRSVRPTAEGGMVLAGEIFATGPLDMGDGVVLNGDYQLFVAKYERSVK